MEIRAARLDDLPLLEERLAESPHERVNLRDSVCWVAVEDGKIIGMLPLRLVWQAEPLYIFPEVTNTITRSRACYGMWQAMEKWVKGPDNTTGVRWYFAISRSEAFIGWSKRVGLHRIYEGAAHFIKHL